MRSDDSFFHGLHSAAAGERREVVTELRAILRSALARSFGRQFSDSDLDDLTQESLLRICSRLDGFEHQCRFTTWATTIAVNCALTALRQRRHRLVSLDDVVAQASSALVQEAALAEDHVEAELARLQRGIAQVLTDRQRQATLARLGGLPLAEIASRLGTSQGAIYKLLHDARQRLRTYLEAEPDGEQAAAPAGAP